MPQPKRAGRRRNQPSTRVGGQHRKIHDTTVIRTPPPIIPSSGADEYEPDRHRPLAWHDSAAIPPLNSAACIAADQRMGNADRQTGSRADVGPQRCTHQSAEHDEQLFPRCTERFEIDKSARYRLRHGRAEQKRRDEVEERRPHDGLHRRSTRVDTTVAIELAASLNPLRSQTPARRR